MSPNHRHTPCPTALVRVMFPALETRMTNMELRNFLDIPGVKPIITAHRRGASEGGNGLHP